MCLALGCIHANRVSSNIFNDWNACGKVMGLAPWHTVWNSNSDNTDSNNDTNSSNSNDVDRDGDDTTLSADSIWKAQPLMVTSVAISSTCRNLCTCLNLLQKHAFISYKFD
jgi:hypothetical protein